MTGGDPALRIRQRPRNPWSRLLAATDCLEAGEPGAARAILENLRFHPQARPEVLQIWAEHLAEALAAPGVALPLDHPQDYLANEAGFWRPPFRRLDSARTVPRPYPWGMALPAFAGSGNDGSFLEDAATTLEPLLRDRPLKLHVVWVALPGLPGALDRLVDCLASQISAPPLALTVLSSAEPPGWTGSEAARAPFPVRYVEAAFSSPEAQEVLATILPEADQVLFLQGDVGLDRMALARAARLARVSDLAVQPLVPMAKGMPEPGKGELVTPFTPELPRRSFASRYPFREMAGLNALVSARLLRRLQREGDGPVFHPRLPSPAVAARELAYRMYVRGAWFLPLRVPHLDPGPAPAGGSAEHELYKSLCPNHWDRKRDAVHEVSKVSVYIPAYNASKYIERAVESVLSQDMADLDVCIANDGSRDGTLALLERLYANEPRVRWVDNANGGIGFASNTAIRMSRSLYIGQLDSDDCLKPGAVRRLSEYLDEHASVVCAYASCERIDAAGAYLQDEYSWPVFSREKMMITSIAHHFRMFRRQAWERTTGFREDIVNGVDYDIFLKLSEVGEFHHIDEKLYQRRWHGENTSHVNEHHQTTNTHRVQREALKRQGLARTWDVHVPDPAKPRNVTYRLKEGTKMVVFWPDYSRSNPYQKLLYADLRQHAEVVAGDIDACLKLIDTKTAPPADITFHLHWINALFRGIQRPADAQAVADAFAGKLERLRMQGGRLVWTIHNTLSHDTLFPEVEIDLSARIAGMADVIHLHSAGSLEEVARVFPVPEERLLVARHGHYVGAYPDLVPRDEARAALGIAQDEDVILFTGLVRPYKGVEQLVGVFRRILADRPQARLLIAGQNWFDPLADLDPPLSSAESARILTTGRFVEDAEFQMFFRAADLAAYPYHRTLTSGSLMLALSFGVPTVIPRTAMTAEILQGREAGLIYDAEGGEAALEAALRELLHAKDQGRLERISRNARRVAEETTWPDLRGLLG